MHLPVQLGLLSAVPYIAYFIMINVGGIAADYIRARNIMTTLNMRRTAILIGELLCSGLNTR